MPDPTLLRARELFVGVVPHPQFPVCRTLPTEEKFISTIAPAICNAPDFWACWAEFAILRALTLTRPPAWWADVVAATLEASDGPRWIRTRVSKFVARVRTQREPRLPDAWRDMVAHLAGGDAFIDEGSPRGDPREVADVPHDSAVCLCTRLAQARAGRTAQSASPSCREAPPEFAAGVTLRVPGSGSLSWPECIVAAIIDAAARDAGVAQAQRALLVGYALAHASRALAAGIGDTVQTRGFPPDVARAVRSLADRTARAAVEGAHSTRRPFTEASLTATIADAAFALHEINDEIGACPHAACAVPNRADTARQILAFVADAMDPWFARDDVDATADLACGDAN